jgi:glutathione S-transferase
VRYFGDKTCVPCRETKMMLDKYGISYQFENVEGIPEYKGRTPILELDDGTVLEGKELILEWLGSITED